MTRAGNPGHLGFALYQSDTAPRGVYPPVGLYEWSDGFVLTAELPGLTLKDIELSIEANRLTLRGERKIAYPDDGKTSLHRRERQAGTFRRTVALPALVDGEKVEASYRDGVLVVKLPLAASHRSRRIEVRA